MPVLPIAIENSLGGIKIDIDKSIQAEGGAISTKHNGVVNFHASASGDHSVAQSYEADASQVYRVSVRSSSVAMRRVVYTRDITAANDAVNLGQLQKALAVHRVGKMVRRVSVLERQLALLTGYKL